MWLFILIYVLGLNISQASAADESTQMYYVKLAIDKNAIESMIQLLKDIVIGHNNNTTVQVSDLQKTTICKNVTDGVRCTCELRHKWSDATCESKTECCGNDACTFPKGDAAAACVLNTSVTINGTMDLSVKDYAKCLDAKTSETYKICNDKVLKQMKTTYSTLSGFISLTILKYRLGSIHVDFLVHIGKSVDLETLVTISKDMSVTLGALTLETTGWIVMKLLSSCSWCSEDKYHEGVVQLKMPNNPVCYNSEHKLECSVQQDLPASPLWQFKSKEGSIVDITNGTQADLTDEPRRTTATIKGINALWEGEYSCVYKQKSNRSLIIHKASGEMDVALLPNIAISTSPSFPSCLDKESVTLTVQCNVDDKHEKYKVEWNSSNTEVRTPKESGDPKGIYEAQIAVLCDNEKTAEVTCSFINDCNQTRNASTNINIIHENDKFCKAENDWENTKAGFIAVLKCKDNGAGQRQRNCTREGGWEPETTTCVNKAVNNVLQRANIIDIGLGDIQENAADVFYLLQNITNDTQNINTFANMNASVQVLFTLSQKSNLKPNSSTAQDFLESSSNLLNKSLVNTWKTKVDRSVDDLSLAEVYLVSVEKLIMMADLPNLTQKANTEVAKKRCSDGSPCDNTVFNVTVLLESEDPGIVKTAGFKELEKYLPNDNEEYEPNSIVVSTTAENKSGSIKIQIDFQLLSRRPRNVEIQCVAWDNATRNWSSEGCKWDGPSKQGRCICSHLSSFAILMSKYPMNITFMTEITYAGLSVSVMSLIISLTIELLVWSAVVKTNSLYLRHTAHVNISLTLLIADCCFLASSEPSAISAIWCEVVVLLKHFCYLAMFFWMLCLSSTLLHQTTFPLHQMSKKVYLRYSLILGYVCPLLIVVITFITNKTSSANTYFSRDTCWLVYDGFLEGSIFTFILPVGIIVFINIFSMVVVIMKLLHHPQFAKPSSSNEKKALVTVMRSVILLTPIFGVTWIFGFAVMIVDLTSGPMAFAVNYIFTGLNAFQGFFILLTTCLFDKMTRDALLDRFKTNSPSSITEGSTKLESLQK